MTARRRDRAAQGLVDPDWLVHGQLAHARPVWDNDPDQVHDTLRAVIDAVLGRLDEPQRSAVQMVVLQGMTLQDAADHLEADVHRPVGQLQDRKAVWRWTHQGLREVKAMLAGSPWIDVLLPGSVPLADDELGGGLASDAAQDRDIPDMERHV